MTKASGWLTGRGIAAAFRLVRGSGSGDFGDDGRHAVTPRCIQANAGRVFNFLQDRTSELQASRIFSTRLPFKLLP